jgi:hypothetical protein
MGQFLKTKSKDRKHKFAAKTRRCCSSKALFPEIKQAGSVEKWQLFK